MRPSWRRVRSRAVTARLTGILALALLAATACSSQATPSKDSGFGVDTPVVGLCRVLVEADIEPASNETPTVACSKPHTAVTIAVGAFTVAAITNQSLTDGSLGKTALRACTSALDKTVGGDATAQHTSTVGLAYFLPNQSQLSGGAHWYRCDLVIGGTDGYPLQNLPAKVDGLLAGAVPDSLVACRTTTDFDKGRLVSCDEHHVLRAIGTAPLPGGAAYPGDDALKAASTTGCEPVIKAWLHGRVDGGDAYQWPDQTGWTVVGDHIATCWTVSTS